MATTDQQPVTGDDSLRDILVRLTTLAEQGPAQPIDPTANVSRLVDAAERRQDGLRKADARRLDELSRQEHRHRKETRKLDAKYRDAERSAEARRLDALLEAQTSAATLSQTRAEATASALAERVETSARTLAASVEATAKANQAAVEATAKAFGERISPLEQARYQAAGGKEQAGESRDRNQWTVERVIALGLAALGVVYFLIQQSQRTPVTP